MEHSEEVWPSIMDVVEAYQRINPRAKIESTKAQVKRWVRHSGKKAVPKRLKP